MTGDLMWYVHYMQNGVHYTQKGDETASIAHQLACRGNTVEVQLGEVQLRTIFCVI